MFCVWYLFCWPRRPSLLMAELETSAAAKRWGLATRQNWNSLDAGYPTRQQDYVPAVGRSSIPADAALIV